ncbi:regucalcin-like protein, partial [Leptotrombidium deliense]
VAKEVFKYNVSTKQLERKGVTDNLICLIPTVESDDQFLAVGVDTLYCYTWSTGELVSLHKSDFGGKSCYMGAAIDSRGRLWLGTMDPNFGNNAALYLLQPNGELVKKADNKCEVTDIVWSPDETKMYTSDSGNTIVYVYDFDVNTGEVSNEREFVSFLKRPEYAVPPDFEVSRASNLENFEKVTELIGDIEMPTGLLMTKNGSLWVCCYHVDRIVKLNAETTDIEDEIKLPYAVRTPILMIAGDDDKEMYFQSVSAFLTQEMKRRYLETGKTFVIRKVDNSKFDVISSP